MVSPSDGGGTAGERREPVATESASRSTQSRRPQRWRILTSRPGAIGTVSAPTDVPPGAGSATARYGRAAPRIRLTRRWRRCVLVLHLLSSGAWIGIDVVVAVLVTTGWFAADAEVRSLAYQALATFVVQPMLVAGLGCLTTGLLLGLATQWGLLRYWWVLAKLTLNVGLCVLIVVVLQPGMPDVAAYGSELLAGTPPDNRVARLFFPPAVSLTALSLATALAVVKPWGRVRRPNAPSVAPAGGAVGGGRSRTRDHPSIRPGGESR